jgi:hypothetical protein
MHAYQPAQYGAYCSSIDRDSSASVTTPFSRSLISKPYKHALTTRFAATLHVMLCRWSQDFGQNGASHTLAVVLELMQQYMKPTTNYMHARLHITMSSTDTESTGRGRWHNQR